MSQDLTTKRPLTLSKRVLWGYNIEQMKPDEVADATTIISRVFDTGTHADMQAVIAYYGVERIRQVLLDSPELQGQTISLTAVWLGLEPEQYRAFKKRSSEPVKYISF